MSTKLPRQSIDRFAMAVTPPSIRSLKPRRSPSGAPCAEVEVEQGTPVSAVALRARLGISQAIFARLLGVSSRTVSGWEAAGASAPALGATPHRRLVELDRLRVELAELVKADAVGPWLTKPNAAFERAKPLELIERGETDRLWSMIYEMSSGDPS